MSRQKATGLAHVYGFDVGDELPHGPSGDQLWQESMWLYWGEGCRRGGCVHIGQEVPKGVGNIWASAFTEDYCYRYLAEDLPLDPQARVRGRHEAGGYRMWVENGRTYIEAAEGEMQLSFVMEDDLPYPSLLPLFPVSNDSALRTWSSHYQTPGRVRGTLRLRDRIYKIDALGQRGHSWGPRNHVELRGHGSRWTTGSFGDLTYSMVTGIKLDGTSVRSGFVVDGGEVQYTRDIDVTVEVDIDGISYRSGCVRMTMPDGRVYDFRSSFSNANMYGHHGIHLVVTGGDLRCGSRTGGYSAWEIKHRPIVPHEKVTVSIAALLDNGIAPVAGAGG